MDWTIETKHHVPLRTAKRKKIRDHGSHNINPDGSATCYRIQNGEEGTGWTTWKAEAEMWLDMLKAGYRPVAAQTYRLP